MITELYPSALDCGILPESFWASSLAELQDRMKSHHRIRTREAREKISLQYELAGLIGLYVSKLFDDKNEIRIPHPWDTYPELFEAEKRQFEAVQKAEQLETVREMRHAYAERYNRSRRESKIN